MIEGNCNLNCLLKVIYLTQQSNYIVWNLPGFDFVKMYLIFLNHQTSPVPPDGRQENKSEFAVSARLLCNAEYFL